MSAEPVLELGALCAYLPSAVIVRDAVFANLGFDLAHPSPGMLTYGGDASFLARALAAPEVSCVVTTSPAWDEYLRTAEAPPGKGVALVPDPRRQFFGFHNHLVATTDFYRRRGGRHIGESCRISRLASLPDDNVRIGDHVVIEDFVKVFENTTIGDGAYLGTGSVLGGEGFQYLHDESGVTKVRHAGGVEIGRNAELHSHCVVDRGIFREDTVVGDDTKLDNFVYFAHRSRIGRRCRVAGGAAIMGSVVIGDDVWIGPQSVISNSLSIGDRAFVAIGAAVVRDVAEGEQVAGNFAVDKRAFIRRNLDAMPPRRSR
jgi:acyl-[acyl carrier protein]--UDP-N-acetylglucosamine O-acyltransferase